MLFQVGHEFLGGPVGSEQWQLEGGNGTCCLLRSQDALFTLLPVLEFEVQPFCHQGFHGVMVSTQDSESCDPSSNLGGT